MISTISDRLFHDEQFPTRTSNYFSCANYCGIAACSNIPALNPASIFEHCHVGHCGPEHTGSQSFA